MKINSQNKIPAKAVKMDGVKNVKIKILLGSKDGSENIIMRYFTIAPGGNTSLHSHNYEHLIKVEKNKGVVVDEHGKKHEIKEGHSIFVAPNTQHQFQNPFKNNFEFICIIPNQKK